MQPAVNFNKQLRFFFYCLSFVLLVDSTILASNVEPASKPKRRHRVTESLALKCADKSWAHIISSYISSDKELDKIGFNAHIFLMNFLTQIEDGSIPKGPQKDGLTSEQATGAAADHEAFNRAAKEHSKHELSILMLGLRNFKGIRFDSTLKARQYTFGRLTCMLRTICSFKDCPASFRQRSARAVKIARKMVLVSSRLHKMMAIIEGYGSQMLAGCGLVLAGMTIVAFGAGIRHGFKKFSVDGPRWINAIVLGMFGHNIDGSKRSGGDAGGSMSPQQITLIKDLASIVAPILATPNNISAAVRAAMGPQSSASSSGGVHPPRDVTLPRNSSEAALATGLKALFQSLSDAITTGGARQALGVEPAELTEIIRQIIETSMGGKVSSKSSRGSDVGAGAVGGSSGAACARRLRPPTIHRQVKKRGTSSSLCKKPLPKNALEGALVEGLLIVARGLAVKAQNEGVLGAVGLNDSNLLRVFMQEMLRGYIEVKKSTAGDSSPSDSDDSTTDASAPGGASCTAGGAAGSGAAASAVRIASGRRTRRSMIGIVKAFFKPSPVDPNSADASSVPVLPASDEHGVGKSILPICAAEQAFVEWMGKQGTLLDVLRNILPLTAAVATNGDLRRLVTASISVSKTQYSSAGLVEILRELEIPARPPASIGVTGAVRYSTRSRSNPPTIVPPGGSSGIGGGAAGNAQPRT